MIGRHDRHRSILAYFGLAELLLFGVALLNFIVATVVFLR